jgi:hypothetical protein
MGLLSFASLAALTAAATLFLALPPALALPLPLYPAQHSHACLAPNDGWPFCDTSLPVQDRVQDLISRLSLADKVANRYDHEQANAALGLPDYNYNQEGLHGLGAQCFAATATSGTRCPSVFAAPPTLAASWNTSLLREVGSAISTEARAYNNFGGNRGYQNRAVDLNAWLPSINIARDPRWGRQVETYSEDPWATGQFGASIVAGAQQGSDGGASGNGFLKLIVAVKHATAYQVENNRFARNENITAHDLADTFYPAWEAVMEQGQASGFMCAYPAVNGVPCCADEFFMTELMKDTWGMGSSHGGGSYVQGDCGAIENIASAHHYASNTTFAAAMALDAGADVDCGRGFPGQLGLALELGLTTEQELDASLARTYTMQMLAGRFDPPALQPYMSIPFEAIKSAAHSALSFESGLQGMVLLRNDKGLLPLSTDAAAAAPAYKLALVGPLANSNDLAGNYYEQACPSGGLDCIPSLYGALNASSNPAVSYAPGCAVDSGDSSQIAAAVAVAAAADVVILALGTNTQVAQEGNDRADTSLPGQQANLTAQVLALGKPTVVLLLNGGTMEIDSIVALSDPAQPIAIVEAFFPGDQGALPIVEQLFKFSDRENPNRWGKLPVTYYGVNFTNSIPIDDMRMASTPGVFAGRGYRYYDGSLGPVLFPFAFGLSYTTFSLAGSCPQAAAWRVAAAAHGGALAADARGRGLAALAAPPLQCSVTVTNTGTLDGDEVVFLFVTPGKRSSAERAADKLAAAQGKAAMPFVPDALAIKQLAGFERVRVPAGGHVVVPFDVDVSALAFVDAAGNRVVDGTDFALEFSRGHGDVLRVPVRLELDSGESRLVARKYPSRRA